MKFVRRDPEKGYLDSWFHVPKSQLNVEGAKTALTFTFASERKETVLALYRETPTHLLVPREFWDPTDFNFPTIDCRPESYARTDVTSKITLDLKSPHETVQRDALQALLESRGGILQLACGKGKTVVFLELLARERVPTLIILDNTHLMKQWREAIDQFLVVPGGVGRIQGDVFDWNKSVVLATYQTLAARAAELSEEVRRHFGLICWDEAHHMAAPTWARSADLFYGKRVALTATPERADGYHVIYDFHLGKIVYKDLRQELKPKFYFLWTGLKLNLADPRIRGLVTDKNGEIHLGKLSSYYATWGERLDRVLGEVRAAAAEGRRILVISRSVDELINLLARWNGRTSLYTDIPLPPKEDVGELAEPKELPAKEQTRLAKTLQLTTTRLLDKGLNPLARRTLSEKKATVECMLQQHRVYEKVAALRTKRQREYLRDLLAEESTAGLMIFKVSPEARMTMLRSKQVMFAVSKYGREGLDEQRLDTIIVSSPLSDRNALQQLTGRVQREDEAKKSPVVVVLEDNVSILVAMCNKLRRHLREWPVEEGGPYAYDNLGHPSTRHNGRTPWASAKLGMV